MSSLPNSELLTVWGEQPPASVPLPEHPRPQFMRPGWQNLNGCWDFEIGSDTTPEHYSDHILVPFSPESVLSGAKRGPKKGETAWYRRSLTIPGSFFKERLLLHFGAVDAECRVFLDGTEIGRHSGGYDPFTIDITGLVQPDTRSTLTVAVTDAYEGGSCCYGKQSSAPGGIWYHGQSGIWQTVWLESIPVGYIEGLRLEPDAEKGSITVSVPNGGGVRYAVMENGKRIAAGLLDEGGKAEIRIPEPHCWTPDDPFLYDLFLNRNEDIVKSYFALRSVRREGSSLLLNGKPLRAAGLLDQGIWPDGLYTAPSDEALVFDIQSAKEMGFNLLRKHVKTEPLRWYYHCDRLGMLVMQDIPNGGDQYPKLWTRDLPLVFGLQLPDRFPRLFGRRSEAGREHFREEALSIVNTLINSPCVIAWTLFNEGWGQFDTAALTETLRQADGTRLIDSASGWHDRGCGDFRSRHVYFRKLRMKTDRRIPAVTECGGFGIAEPGNRQVFSYRRVSDAAGLAALLERFYRRELLPLASRLPIFVYTQLSDVENEKNGLLSANRRVRKVDAALLSKLNGIWINGKEG